MLITLHRQAKTAAKARRFSRNSKRAAPKNIPEVVTDTGKAFIAWLFSLRRLSATRIQDRLCAEVDAEQRLARRILPETNVLVERISDRIVQQAGPKEVFRNVHARRGRMPLSQVTAQ